MWCAWHFWVKGQLSAWECQRCGMRSWLEMPTHWKQWHDFCPLAPSFLTAGGIPDLLDYGSRRLRFLGLNQMLCLCCAPAIIAGTFHTSFLPYSCFLIQGRIWLFADKPCVYEVAGRPFALQIVQQCYCCAAGVVQGIRIIWNNAGVNRDYGWGKRHVRPAACCAFKTKIEQMHAWYRLTEALHKSQPDLMPFSQTQHLPHI